MKAEYIMMDDPRVTFKSTRIGKVFSPEGNKSETVGDMVFRYTESPDGIHQEPRMAAVMSPIKSFNWHPGDYAEIEIEDTPLLGITLEPAEHHYDMDLYIDGEKIYGEFYCISAYHPSSDGFGKIHWIMLDRGKHTVRVEVSDKYNRMLDLTGTTPNHACLSGFILNPDMVFPPPVYSNWMFTQETRPSPIRLALIREGDHLEDPIKEGYLQVDTIPAGGQLYLMDLYGQGSLDVLTFDVDGPVVLEIIDGGVAQPEYPNDFPSWIRRLDLGKPNSGSVRAILDVSQSADSGSLRVMMQKDALFGSRLIIRLVNRSDEDRRISELYMEGTIRVM
jgi:hypothetical protein